VENERDGERLRQMLHDSYLQRRDLIQSKASVSVICSQYPALLTEDGLIQDYKHMKDTTSDIIKKLRMNLVQWCSNVADASESTVQQGSNKEASKFHPVISAMKSYSDCDAKVTCGLLTLPLHFGEDSSLFINQISGAASMAEIRGSILTPHLVVLGSAFEPSYVYLVVDGEVVVKSKSLLDSVCLLLITFYVLWLEYPAKCKNTYHFLQEMVLEEHDKGKNLVKVIRFIDRIAK